MGDGREVRVSVPGTSLADLTEDVMQAVSLVDGLAQDATAALFDTYGVKVVQDGPTAAKSLQSVPLLSVIGFSSDVLSGSLVLALPHSVAERTLPVAGVSLGDWSGELANQLLGRLKNQLLKYKVVLNMSLPVVLSGDGLRLLATKHQITRYYSFSSDAGKVVIRLDMEMSPDFRFTADEDAESGVVDEGELLLF